MKKKHIAFAGSEAVKKALEQRDGFQQTDFINSEPTPTVEQSTDAQGSEPVASRSKAPSTVALGELAERTSSGKKASKKVAGKVEFDVSARPYFDNARHSQLIRNRLGGCAR